jgi:hypothetical protein
MLMNTRMCLVLVLEANRSKSTGRTIFSMSPLDKFFILTPRFPVFDSNLWCSFLHLHKSILCVHLHVTFFLCFLIFSEFLPYEHISMMSVEASLFHCSLILTDHVWMTLFKRGLILYNGG